MNDREEATGDSTASGQAGPGPRRMSPLQLAVQALGFLLGIGIFGYIIYTAVTGENGRQLRRLLEAPLWMPAAAVGLTLLAIALDGLIFWVQLRPEKKLPALDALSTNAVAMLLGFLPFKPSAVARFVIHKVRDGMPFIMTAGWIAAAAFNVLLVTLAILVGTVLRPGLDAVWFIAVSTVIAIGTVAIVLLAGWFRGDRGVARLERFTRPLSIGPLKKLREPQTLRNLQTAATFASHGHATATCMVLRVAFLLALGARFWVVAAALGIQFGNITAALLVLPAVFFLIQAASPVGGLGFREIALTRLAGYVGLTTASLAADGGSLQATDLMTLIALTATATEIVTLIPVALAGAAWLRLDRVIAGRKAALAGGVHADGRLVP